MVVNSHWSLWSQNTLYPIILIAPTQIQFLFYLIYYAFARDDFQFYITNDKWQTILKLFQFNWIEFIFSIGDRFVCM